ncbi:hypothetical protein L227DRAFT_581355 [Lentinus tigrinus ALCF2SS1-6]|uniref:Uncharacterized protein n=1 Tax=Lentinus tigrinus ALCF2SS1-6 TaxID=1328759 RepID=A0A5C2RQK9_9APHY|nr:hypothetical protein L227DRAFT_581355 [Lentinus tigrinus ALCF2SS1-6]
MDRWVQSLFDVMDPYECGLFDDLEDVQPRPVLRMVFALASPKAGVSTPERPAGRATQQPGPSQKKQKRDEVKETEEEAEAGEETPRPGGSPHTISGLRARVMRRLR